MEWSGGERGSVGEGVSGVCVGGGECRGGGLPV